MRALLKREQESETGVMKFSTEDYIKYMVQQPRNYNVVVLFSMEHVTQMEPHLEDLPKVAWVYQDAFKKG